MNPPGSRHMGGMPVPPSQGTSQEAMAAVGSIQVLIVLVHSGPLPLWQQPGLTQVGPGDSSRFAAGRAER